MELANFESIEELMDCWKNKLPLQTSYRKGSVEIPLNINHAKNFFISDGIIDEGTWSVASQGKKILFILKEAYEDDHMKKLWNLNDELKNNGPWGQIWRRVCEWTYGIMNTNLNNTARYVPLSWEQGNNLLRQISVMNIKKSDGRHNSSYEEIYAYARADASEIIREIELIDPDIVICGATFGAVNSITGNTIEKGSNDNWFYYTDIIGNKKRLFIDYYHPANRYPALLNYYGIVGIYQQALREGYDQ